jgi:hypothetical protein
MPLGKRKHIGGFQEESLKGLLKQLDLNGTRQAAEMMIKEISSGDSKKLLVETLAKKEATWDAARQDWRCSCCQQFLRASTHLSWHRCAVKWSTSEMGSLVVESEDGKSRCKLCKRIVPQSGHHYCPCTILTLVVFDFSATSFSPVIKGKHDHEHPLTVLREIGTHAGTL